MASSEIVIKPIGTFHSPQVHPYEAGRQSDSHHSNGYVTLESGHNFEQAMTGLDGCERIWIIFQFHHNEHWNPMVLPPRGTDTKVGVFATRSPYRPNQIGMSCVKVLKIEGLKIYVEGADILDGTPILDIKPYVAYADSFPDVEPEWLKTSEKFQVIFDDKVEAELQWLEKNKVSQLRGFLLHQLEYEPTNTKKKRVKAVEDTFVIAYRTWRAQFVVIEDTVLVLRVFSGYSEQDLLEAEDKYEDKETHRLFKMRFPFE